MKFASWPLAEAEGAILAHSLRTADGVIRKGTILGASEVARLAAAGHAEVMAARLDPGDLTEDAAAHALALAVAGENVRAEAPFTGRSNLYATAAGILRSPGDALEAFNMIDEGITLAALPDFRTVAEGELVATMKVIPFALLGRVVAVAAQSTPPLLGVAPFRLRRVAVISTLLPGLAEKVVEKTLTVTRARLAVAGAHVTGDLRVAHAIGPLAGTLGQAARDAELIIVFGASAIADRRDVIPAALEMAGGEVLRLGMPVDPGNLLLLGQLGPVPVLAAPGCARSPKENGFDFVLNRLLAGLSTTARDIARMGAGGLLGDIPSRPFPRAADEAENEASGAAAPAFAAVILAAGRSARMGPGSNKLLEEVGGVPVIRRVALAALASRAGPVIVVTGHEQERVAAALAGLDVRLVHNADHASGMASSLKVGIAAVPDSAAGALVTLGDMPLVEADLFNRLMAAFNPGESRLIAVPVRGGVRGHPVLWSRRYFPALAVLGGDVGARHLLATHHDAVVEVEVSGEAAFLDVDTPLLLAAARAASER